MLGRRPPKNAPALKLGDYLTGTVPAHPVAADHLGRLTDPGLWGNDKYGDCGPVSFYNLRKLVTLYATGTEAMPTQDDVFALYKLVNPTFDPSDPGGPGDAGVDMQTMLEDALKNEVLGEDVMVGFAKVDARNLDEVRAGISIFGGVLYGVNLETSQQKQTDAGGPWDYKASGVWGGHAILAGLYTSDVAAHQADTEVVSWADKIGLTETFEAHQLEEVWVVIFKEHLDHPAFQEGVDVTALAADFTALTGKPFPVVEPSPTPTPNPQPVDDPDGTLASAARGWVSEHHTGGNKTMATALKTWMAAKNL